MSDDSELKPHCCSACGRGHKEVKKLIPGPKVLICDECIIQLFEALAEDEMPELSPKANLLLREKKIVALVKDIKNRIKSIRKEFGHFTKMIEELSALEATAESFLPQFHSDGKSSATEKT